MQNLSTFSVRPSTKKVGKKCVDYTPFGMAMVGRDKQGITGYRYGYNGMEIDPEMKGKGNEYTTEFRQYDPRVGRWMSLDPLMMQFPSMSPYCAFDNNPVLLTDPTGEAAGEGDVDDNYIVDKDGNVTLQTKTDDKYDMIYSEEDWNAKKWENGHCVADQSILKQLSEPNAEGNCGIEYKKMWNKAEGDADDVMEIFKFMADNTDVEWAVAQGEIDGKEKTIISTFHDIGFSPAPEHVGFKTEDITSNLHDHPPTPNRDEKGEIRSIGYREKTGLIKANCDWDIYTHQKASNGNKELYPYQVYFPDSGRLYKVDADKCAIFIKEVVNFKDFNYKK